jgi:SAM-dependent MidA family methyltransferase
LTPVHHALPHEPSLPAPTAEARAHSAALVQLIANEIGAGGWMSFARYMELALYQPGLGYYAGGSTKFGGAGDFVTAPEISSLFSQTLARQVAQILDQAGEQIVELGAGSGRMAHDLLLTLAELGALPFSYAIVELSAELRQRQQQKLDTLPQALRSRVQWLDALPERITGLVLANEVLDALPVRLVAWYDKSIMERGVTWDAQQQLGWADRELGPGALLDRALPLSPPTPYVSEISLAVPALVATLARTLERGALVFIDYGFGAREYYHPQRNRGTLMCHYRHRAHDDPFFLPGLQDITSHVDFTSVALAGIDCGLKLIGYTTQGHFLVNAGITDVLARTSPDNSAEYLPLAAQAQKLLSPAEMGELFKVIALARGLDVPLTGFQAGDLSGLL